MSKYFKTMYDQRWTDSVWILFILGFIQFVDAANLRCYDGSLYNPVIAPLDFPRSLIDSSCILTNRTTKFYISGFNHNETSDESVAILSAYIERGDVNTVYLDCAEEVSEGNLGPALGYLKAVTNAQEIGLRFAAALMMLQDAGLNFTKVHLVGHSLGAQISGITGNRLGELGYRVQRITGLDPAGPLFEGVVSIRGLNKNSAIQVYVVHTDPHGYGISDSVGTADFWPNYEGGKTVQPGCPRGVFPLLSQDGLCSHSRSWRYFAETINDCNCFPAASEPNYQTWIRTNGTTNSIVYMGEYISPSAQGNYYLVTNDRSLYGKGDAGTNPNNRIND